MADLLSRETLVKQHRILDKHVTAAESQAEQAAKAVEDARAHQALRTLFFQEVYELGRRLEKMPIKRFEKLPTRRLKLSSSVSCVAHIIFLDEAGRYALALPNRRSAYIAEATQGSKKLRRVKLRELLGLDDVLLREFLDSMRKVGKRRDTAVISEETSPRQESVTTEADDRKLPNPDLKADRTAHVAPPEPRSAAQ